MFHTRHSKWLTAAAVVGLYCIFSFMWLEYTFLDYSYACSSVCCASITCNRHLISFITSVRQAVTSFVSVSPRLLETDDTEEPKGKMNSPLSLWSDPLLFDCFIAESVLSIT